MEIYFVSLLFINFYEVKKLQFYIALFSVSLIFSGAFAQEKERIIQFSGLVVGGDSLYGIWGVHIYVPHSGRGSISNEYGYFSMPVLISDSIIISAVGFKKQHIIIPDDAKNQSYTAIIELIIDTTILPTVEIYPYPTVELFKQAFLALELDDENQSNAQKNLDEKVLARILYDSEMDASMNYTNYMNQEVYKISTQRFDPRYANPLLNPFAWIALIQSIRRGDFKKKKKIWEEE